MTEAAPSPPSPTSRPGWLRARVAEVRQETPWDRTLVFAPADGDALPESWRPGQYVTILLPHEDPPRERPYSLSGASGAGRPLRITARLAGSWGRPIYELPVGAEVRLQAPAGRFVLDVGNEDRLVLVAGGSGVTPFRAFIEQAESRPRAGPTLLVHASRARDHLLFHDEFRRWANVVPNFIYAPTVTGDVDETWTGDRGRPSLLGLREHVPAGRRTIVYACGPPALVDDAMAWAEALGVHVDDRRRERGA